MMLRFSGYQISGLEAFEKGDYVRAAADFLSCLENNPGCKNADIYNYLGLAYWHLNQHELARTQFDRAIELNPSFAAAHSNRGRTFDSEMNSVEAIASHMRACELDPKNAKLRHHLAASYSNIGNYAESLYQLMQSLKLEPTASVTLRSLKSLITSHSPFIAIQLADHRLPAHKLLHLLSQLLDPNTPIGEIWRRNGRQIDACFSDIYASLKHAANVSRFIASGRRLANNTFFRLPRDLCIEIAIAATNSIDNIERAAAKDAAEYQFQKTVVALNKDTAECQVQKNSCRP